MKTSSFHICVNNNMGFRITQENYFFSFDSWTVQW